MPSLDPPLPPLPKIKLSRLRDIGWSMWDPMGLLGAGQDWADEDCSAFADEYDGYLLQAAGALRNGKTEETVVSYLTDIEINHMGLGARKDATARAKEVVAAIQTDDKLWIYPD